MSKLSIEFCGRGGPERLGGIPEGAKLPLAIPCPANQGAISSPAQPFASQRDIMSALFNPKLSKVDARSAMNAGIATSTRPPPASIET